jgi:tetratricopeptide (TPR) repeat protein
MVYTVLATALAVGLSAGLWLIYGRGPRRSRAYRRARRLLARGSRAEALEIAKELQSTGELPPVWQEQVRTLTGDCHQFAADIALKELRFEEALEHGRQAATYLGLDAAEQQNQVVERMLAEARRLFSLRDTDAVIQLLQRTFAIRAPCPEGSFWLGLCQIREGDTNAAMALMTAAHEQSGKQFLDPAFYLGLLLHRRGQPQEALRYLAEANRVDGTCPFVTWEMGIALVAAGGDAALATRALRRAVGPRGLAMWLNSPDRAWVEAFPEGRSYVRRLAEHNLYVCPLLGSDLSVLLRQGRQALGEALLRQGTFQEAADVFGQLLQEAPPTVPLLRGLGLSLARLQRFDQAYKHLRIALETEQPKDPLTAGYLALCGAMARPTQPEDKAKNVTWALRLLARYPLLGDLEWVGLLSAVHAEARALDLLIGVEDQVLLCDALAAVASADAAATAAYRHLAASYPEAVKPAHAWLFARAAATGAVASPVEGRDVWLFARAFADPVAAREFFEGNGWDFGDAEFAYLEKSASLAPGRFPEALGADYAPRGEQFLLERSHNAERAGDSAGAQRAAEALLRMAPQNPAAHDRLACLLYRKGDCDRAAALLEGWHRLKPHDHWPLVRQAILEQERGNAARRSDSIDRALGLTRGRLRAAVAFLGARLALRQSVGESKTKVSDNGAANPPTSPDLSQARQLLEECLREDPAHTEAMWCLAAVRSVAGERGELAAQAPAMDRPQLRDGRYHYLGAVCSLAAADYGEALERVRRAAYADTSLAGEAYFLSARVHLHQGNGPEAREALERAAAANGPSASHARALLGGICFKEGTPAEAVRWWKQVDPGFRAARGLDDPLRQTAFLAGLNDFAEGRFEEAAERFREAGRLGLRDRRLGPLLAQALVHAGRELLYQEDDPKRSQWPGRGA